MSWISEFEIGIWNAWIFIIPLLVVWISGIKFFFSKRMPDVTPPSKREDKILSNLSVIIIFGSFVYSVFLPLKLETIWFYIGLIVYFVGLVVIAETLLNFSATPINKPVTNGIYRYSRNPMFIGWFLLYFGITIITLSWVYLLLTVFLIFITVYLSPYEEAITLQHYGDPYKEYLEKTPRWIGFPREKKK